MPIEVPLRHTLELLTPHLRPGLELLEVGCGDGALAARLSELGCRVLAVEPSSSAAEAARQRGVEVLETDLLDERLVALGREFGIVFFGRSLHHVDGLEQAIERVRRLLEPDEKGAGRAPGETGLLICEELDREHVDAATAAWFYAERQRLMPGASLPGPAGAAPLERWRIEHRHEPPLHTGAVMLAALAGRFEIERLERVPYLYRYLCSRLPDDPAGCEQAERLLRDEAAGIASGELLPVGLRFAARPLPLTGRGSGAERSES